MDGPSDGGADDQATYPPWPHVLRDLGLEVEVLDDGITAARLEPRTSSDDTDDSMPLGVIATAVDVVAGAVCARAIAPDWMATSVMSLQLDEVVARHGVLLEASVLRAGRSAVTVEVTLRQPRSGSGAVLVGTSVLTFARLARRDSTLVLPDTGGRPGDRYGFGSIAEGGGRVGVGVAGFDAAIGCEAIDVSGGRTSTEISAYVRNSFGAVNGGVVAGIADAAARSIVRSPDEIAEDAWRTRSLTVSFLGQGRAGPVETSADVVQRDGATRLVRVEVSDGGQPDAAGRTRTMAIAHLALGRPSRM